MKFLNLILSGLKSLTLLGLLLASAQAADKETPLVARARTVTPTAAPTTPVEPQPAPVSKFVMPRKVAEGRDPFFPNSTRVYVTETVTTNNTPLIVPDLILKGISGTTEQPLAIINTTTFTTGESNEVLLKNGRLRIQCLEINMNTGTVLLQIGSERRELRLGQK